MYAPHNLIQFYELIATHSSTRLENSQGYRMVFTPNYCWPNTIFELDIKGENLSERIDNMVAKMEKGEAPPMIRVQPTESNVYNDFLKRNCIRTGQWTAMSMELNQLSLTAGPAQIKELNSTDQIDAWVEVVETELMKGGLLEKELFKQLLGVEGIYFFGAYLNQKLVSTALTYIKDDVVGIYLIATDFDARGQGIGKQITTFALDHAREKGCRITHLQATTVSHSVYKALGFQNQGEIKGFLMFES